MPRKKNIVCVVPVGDISLFAVKVIAAHITGYLHLPTEVLPALDFPDYAYDPQRYQYNAGTILRNCDQLDFGTAAKVVAVLDVDLFIPLMTHVFGEARQGGRLALVSLFRLKMDSGGIPPSPTLLYERAAKVALHEVGHLFSLVHCEDRGCLMHFSAELQDLDRSPFHFCRYCATFFRDAIKQSGSS